MGVNNMKHITFALMLLLFCAPLNKTYVNIKETIDEQLAKDRYKIYTESVESVRPKLLNDSIVKVDTIKSVTGSKFYVLTVKMKSKY